MSSISETTTSPMLVPLATRDCLVFGSIETASRPNTMSRRSSAPWANSTAFDPGVREILRGAPSFFALMHDKRCARCACWSRGRRSDSCPLAADPQAGQGPDRQSAVVSCWRCAAEHPLPWRSSAYCSPRLQATPSALAWRGFAQCSARGITPQAPPASPNLSYLANHPILET
jgi:hypothetical protein